MMDPLHITKSKIRSAVLELFFNNPAEEYYLRQIAKIIGFSAGNIRREMIKLQTSGLLSCRAVGNVKLYKLNPGHHLYHELKGIIGKTVGIEGALKEIFRQYESVDFAFMFGSFGRGLSGKDSDIDIMVISATSPKDIKTSLFEYQSKIGREINSTVYTRDDFLKKLAARNHFIISVIREKKIFVKGSEDEFRRFIQIRKTGKT